MKKLFITVSILALLTACGGVKTETNENTEAGNVTETAAENKSDKLIGKWQLESVSGETLSDNEKTATTNFSKDGTFTQTRGDKSRDGKWDYVEATSFINMIVGDRNEPLILLSCDDMYLKAIITRDGKPSNDTLTLKHLN